MATIYCSDTQDRIPLEYFAQGKAIWCGGKPYLKFAADKLRLRPDPAPPARFAAMLAGTQPPKNPTATAPVIKSSSPVQTGAGSNVRGLDLTPAPFSARKSNASAIAAVSPAASASAAATHAAPDKPAAAPQPQIMKAAPAPISAQPQSFSASHSGAMHTPIVAVAAPASMPVQVSASARMPVAPLPAPSLDSPTAMRIQLPKFAMDPPAPAADREREKKPQRTGGTTMIAKRGVFSWEKLEKSSANSSSKNRSTEEAAPPSPKE